MTNPVVLRRLYRSLLKASKPFSPLHNNSRAAVYTSLLHRTGIDDGISWDRVLQQMAKRQEKIAANNDNHNKKNDERTERRQRSPEQARDLTRSYVDNVIDDDDDDDKWFNEEGGGGGFNQSSSHHDMETSLEERRLPYRVLFRRLLREVVTGLDGSSQMKFPSQVVPNTLQEVIQREFRRPATTTTTTTTGDNGLFPFDEATRQQAAFIALRELNTKLSWIDSLLPPSSSTTTDQEKERNQRQAAKGVTPIHPLQPSEYLKAGTFLVAHPLLTGYFRRTVVCILDHSERQGTSNGGTYGLVVNRIGVSPSTGKDQTLTDVLRTIPPPLAEVFGESSVRDGGPVHMSIQMIHSAESPQQPSLGGTVLLSTPTQNTTTTTPPTTTTTNHPTDRSIYYQGDIIEAAEAVSNGQLDRGDISFYVGASCWEVRQLESEIERGYWLPCQGPPSIALSGTCEHNVTDTTTNERPKNDLWLSMMCALGHEEANLAHLVLDDTGSEHGDACDSF